MRRFPILSAAFVATSVAFYATGVHLPLHGASEGWGRVAGAATSLVSHSSIGHLLSNMVVIALFGAAVEIAYGTRWMLALAAGDATILLWVAGPDRVISGASGLAVALLAFAAIAVVRHSVDLVRMSDTWVTWVAVPAAAIAGVTGAFQMFYDISHLDAPAAAGPGRVVGHDLHLWGAAVGALCASFVAARALPELIRARRAPCRI